MASGAAAAAAAAAAVAAAAMNKIERAHQMYREGLYEEALCFYTEALSMARTKNQKIALHSNRAACFLKLHDFNKAAEECTSVLELDNKHSGALMLRAQTLVTIKEYQSALFDVNRLLELNPSSDAYRNLHARLKTQLALAPIPEAEVELEEEDEDEDGYEDKAELKEEMEELQNEKELAEGEFGSDQKIKSLMPTLKSEVATELQENKELSKQQTVGWKAIPTPKGHSRLDYSRWDRVEDDSSEEEDDDDDESQPQYRFRVRTVGVRPVK